jgi:chorismate mutase
VAVRGIRGAITVEENSPEAIIAATDELLRAMIDMNEIDPAEVASALFTTTVDLNAAFPAYAARRLGWLAVPLMCAHEMAVPGDLPRCIRILLHLNTDKPQTAMRHAYLRGAVALRRDLIERFGQSDDRLGD